MAGRTLVFTLKRAIGHYSSQAVNPKLAQNQNLNLHVKNFGAILQPSFPPQASVRASHASSFKTFSFNRSFSSSVTSSFIKAANFNGKCLQSRCFSTGGTVSETETAKGANVGAIIVAGTLAIGGFAAAAYYYMQVEDGKGGVVEEEGDEEHISNWSGTHEVRTRVYVRPESLEDLEAVVREAHEQGQKLRPVGSAISPNGLALNSAGMVNLAFMDKVLSVDPVTRQVRVEAGARVEQVVEALRPHGLTLQNYASVREQQLGGFIQVSAHGTGSTIPPVDEQVVSLRLVTPAKGTLDLSPKTDPELFYFARCGLGTLGVVADVTLQCVPSHQLLEETFVSDMNQIRKNHRQWLKEYRHLRYMWIPHTPAVVVVRSNLYKSSKTLPPMGSKLSEDERLAHVRALYKSTATEIYDAPSGTEGKSLEDSSPSPPSLTNDSKSLPESKSGVWSGTGTGRPSSRRLSDSEIDKLSITELRDQLLALDPLNFEHVVRINEAEAEYWKLSSGYRIGWSDEILGFDCGGQQWVSEVAFPAMGPPRLWQRSQQDLEFMKELLSLVKEKKIPSPSPFEQRWTSGSRSPMSPAKGNSGDLFSWVGIIMYLPTDDPRERAKITEKFFDFKYETAKALWDKYGAHEHWAKLEIPADPETRKWLKNRLQTHFPVDDFNKWRAELDPKNILSNDLIDEFIPRPQLFDEQSQTV